MTENTSTGSITEEDKIVPDRLTRGQKFLFVSIEIPVTLLEVIVLSSYTYYFFIVMGFKDSQYVWLYYVGVAIYITIDALNDFYFGRWSDRKKETRMGRRTFFFIVVAPLWGLITLLMWIPWSTTNFFIIWLHFVITMIAFDTAMTIIMINWMALRGEITDSNQERNKLEFGIKLVSVIPGVIIAIFVIGGARVGTNEFFMLLFLIVPVSVALLILAGIFLKERPELYRNQPDIGLIETLKIVGRSKSFLLIALVGFFGMVATFMGVALVFFQILILGVELIIILILIGIPISLGSSYLFLRLQTKYEPYKMWVYGSIAGLILAIFGFIVILQYDALNPDPTLALWLVLISILSGIVGGVQLFYGSALYAPIDEAEVETGIRQDGVFMGIFHFFMQIAEGIGPVLATIILIMVGFNEDVFVNPAKYPEVIQGLKIWGFVFGFSLAMASFVALLFYPLHGERLVEVKKQLAERRKELEIDR